MTKRETQCARLKKRLRYKSVKDGEWQQPIKRGYKMVCCDCGLVHRMQFRVFGGRVQLRGWRMVRETAQYRKQRRIVVR